MTDSKMAESRDVSDNVAKTYCRKFLETAEGFYSKNIAVQNLQPTVTWQMPSLQIYHLLPQFLIN